MRRPPPASGRSAAPPQEAAGNPSRRAGEVTAGKGNEERQYLVEDLSVETVTALAGRLAAATRFEHLVYRESEIDALWTLADIALGAARRCAAPEPAEIQTLTKLKDLISRAHDLVPDGQVQDAAELLRQAAAVIDADRK